MIQSFIYGAYLPEKLIICADASTRPNPAAKLIDNWRIWPYAMIPVAVFGPDARAAPVERPRKPQTTA